MKAGSKRTSTHVGISSRSCVLVDGRLGIVMSAGTRAGRTVGIGVATGAAGTGVALGVEGVAAGVAVGPGVVVAPGVALAVGVAVATGCASMIELTFAEQRTREPPPFAEPLHWSTFTESVALIVDEGPTVQMNPTLVPPLPEPLHCPTVAAVTEVTPGVFAGVHVPGAPVPVMTEPTHWYTVAAVGAAPPVIVFVIVTLQMSTPPPPFAEPLHWATDVTSSVDVVVVVVQVPAPAPMGPAAPTQRVTVTVVGLAGSMVPVLVTKFAMVTVHEMPWPPTFDAPSSLH